VPVLLDLTHKHSPDEIGIFSTSDVLNVNPLGTLIVCKSTKLFRVISDLYKIKSVDGRGLDFLQIIPTILIVLKGHIWFSRFDTAVADTPEPEGNKYLFD